MINDPAMRRMRALAATNAELMASVRALDDLMRANRDRVTEIRRSMASKVDWLKRFGWRPPPVVAGQARDPAWAEYDRIYAEVQGREKEIAGLDVELSRLQGRASEQQKILDGFLNPLRLVMNEAGVAATDLGTAQTERWF